MWNIAHTTIQAHSWSFSRLDIFLTKYKIKALKLHCRALKLYTGASKLYTEASLIWGSGDPQPQDHHSNALGTELGSNLLGSQISEVSFVSYTTSHVGLFSWLESIEHDFIKAMKIQAGNWMLYHCTVSNIHRYAHDHLSEYTLSCV